MGDEESIEPNSLEYREFQHSLQTLPIEVFLHICSFLDGKELIKTLKLVCKSFYEILSDDSAWRTWLKHRWPEFPSSYICYNDDVISSPTLCLYIDRGLNVWSKEETNFKNFSASDTGHISTVDAVKLIQGGRVGISGSRDRSLAVWDTSDELTLLEHKNAAHSGWIWSIASCPKSKDLYSCSWDGFIKQWALDQQLTEVSAFKCKAAVLSVVCRPDLVAAGLFSPRVELFDPRGGQIGGYSSHTRSIMALCLIGNFLVSASEDQTIAIWDLTAGKTFKSGIQVSSEGHPMTLSFNEGKFLFVGDTESRLHIFDTQSDSFQMIESFDLGHKPRGTITSMWHDPGLILTGSKDSTVRVHAATRPPRLITQLTSSHGGITSLDFGDPVLFVGCVNSAVEMWKSC